MSGMTEQEQTIATNRFKNVENLYLQ